MNYATIKPWDIANGPGVRVSLFVSGCTHHCKDCFNPEAWDFDYGEPFTEAVMEHILELLRPDYIRGITFRCIQQTIAPTAPANSASAIPPPRNSVKPSAVSTLPR